RVKFLSEGPGYRLFLTANEAVLALRGPSQPANQSATGENSSSVAMRLVGASPACSISGLEKLEGKSNYFIGSDPAKWRTEIPNYAKVRYQGVYPGVDLLYYGTHGRLEYHLLGARGTRPGAIELAFEAGDRGLSSSGYHATPLRIDGSGNLVVP